MNGGRKLVVVGCFLLGCSSSNSSGSGPSNAGGSAGTGASGGSAALGGGGAGGAANTGGSLGHAGGPTVTPPYLSDPNMGFANQLTLSGGYLYWLSGTHQIVRAPADASAPPKVIFTHSGSSTAIVAIGGIAVDAQALYFTDEGDEAVASDRGVYKIALDGSGAPTKLADGTQPSAIALDGDTLCFTDETDLREVKISGGSPITLLHGGVDYRTALLVSQGFVYFPAYFGADAQDVYRLPLDVPDPSAPGAGGTGGAGGSAAGGAGASAGGASGAAAGGAGGSAGAAFNGAQKISTVPGRYEILLAQRVDNGDIYWGVEETIYKWSGSAGGASSVAVVTDPLQETATAPPHSVLVPFEGNLYWVGGDGITSSTIFKQSLPDGTRAVVAAGSASSLALDEQYLYAGMQYGINRYAR